jgi:hypothetical protein
MEQAASHIRSINISPDACLLEADVQIGPEKHHIYFRSNDVPLTGNVEAFLAAAILPAMKVGGTLVAEGKANRRFLDALDTIIAIYRTWVSSLQRLEIRGVLPARARASQEGRVGTFFSGGVDSFYTFLKHRDEITDLIYVHGFDMSLENHPLRKRISSLIHEIGSSFGKRVIEVETNLRSFLDAYFRLREAWGPLTHGVVLSSVGHVLFPFFKRIFIAATHTYNDLFPWGSHPLLDPLWSTETLEFIHDGGEATRIDKVALLSKFDIALKSLQVCRSPRSQRAYNCGLCEKCLRTMINLHVVGALDRCTAFNTRLHLKRIAKIVVLDTSTRAFVRENLRALEKSKSDLRLYKALRKILNRPRWQAIFINWLRHKGRQLKRFANKHLHINQGYLSKYQRL